MTSGFRAMAEIDLEALAGRATLLVDAILDSDHERGCEGRHCACECGYDARIEDTALQLRAALRARLMEGANP